MSQRKPNQRKPVLKAISGHGEGSHRLLPFFSYFGSKYRLAGSHYPAPLHDVVIEPFAGSACYSLHYPDREVYLIEKDPQIAAVLRYLVKTTASEIRRLPLLEIGQSRHDLDVSPEASLFIGMCLNRGAAGPRNVLAAWRKEGARSDPKYLLFWGDLFRERVASQVDLIKHWVVVEGDYTEAPDVTATWFIDPPYKIKGRHYRFGSNQIDYVALSRWCRSRSGQVIVCEQEGADWLPFEFLVETKGTVGRLRSGRTREVIYYRENNRPSRSRRSGRG